MPDRIMTFEGLKPGDVVTCAVELTDKSTGAPFWWTTFRCILDVPDKGGRYCRLLSLKMNPDPDRDIREVDIQKDVVCYIPPENWPQGVIAMRMKHITKGLIKLG